MPRVRSADGSNLGGVPRGCEPVVNGRTNPAALDRRLAWAVMAGNQQYDAVPSHNCLVEPAIDRRPSAVEVLAVQIDHPVGCNRAGPELPVPGPVEGLLRNGNRPTRSIPRLRCWRRSEARRGFYWWFGGGSGNLLPRQRPNGRRDARPELGLVRAERAHGPQRPWARGSA